MYSPADLEPAHHSVHPLPHKIGQCREWPILATYGRSARRLRLSAVLENWPFRVDIAAGETREVAVDLSAMPTGR